MLFSEKLKLLRKEHNLTQEGLAEQLGVSRQAITKWESGEGVPEIENLKQLSALFGVSIDELVKDDDDDLVKPLAARKMIKQLEINHTKHFDIKLCDCTELSILPCPEEKVVVELSSNVTDGFVVKADDIYNITDLSVKNKKHADKPAIKLYLPEKYIDEIELKVKVGTLNISDLDVKKLELDGELKYLNIRGAARGKVILNATKCDIEASYEKFEGALEVNTFNSVARISLPAGTVYRTVLKGHGNSFEGATNTEDAENFIELNGIGSKLIINQ